MKTLYYRSKSHDAAFNLALEQYLFETLPKGTRLFMLWQNANAIIIGKFQNTESEINASFVREHNIQIVRRPSGGGAVYHDLGNVNYTFITDLEPEGIPDFSVFCEPVVRALKRYGVDAAVSGRNDICVGDRKISGTAQHASGGRIMHHGTLLYDSDMSVLSRALRTNEDKYASRAVRSVRSRVTNIKPLMAEPMAVDAFIRVLKEEILRDTPYRPLRLKESDREGIERIRAERYGNWDWNYGSSPAYNVVRRRRFPDCGTVELRLDVENGMVRNAAVSGDFFCYADIRELERALEGIAMNETDAAERLKEIDTETYLKGVTTREFLALLLGFEEGNK
jgi:lipoate-protein ligase A